MCHPFHLHGYDFAVLKMGSADELERLNGKNLTAMDWSRSKPCMKNTVSNPPGGFSIIKFRASNPGK